MSIHLSDIEKLLHSFNKANATGSLKSATSLIPSIVNALVALVHEKTGGEPVPSTIANTVITDKGTIVAPSAPKADPLAVIGDAFTTAATTAAAVAAALPTSNSAVQVSEAVQAGANTAVKAAELAADAATIVAAAASVKDVATGVAAAAVIVAAAGETVSDAAETVHDAQDAVQQAGEAADAIKDDVAKVTKRAPKKA